MNKLIEQYESICNKILKRFAKKQELDFDGWVGNNIGGIASFGGQYFFGIHDIVLDLKTKQKKGFILEWQNDMVRYSNSKPRKQTINYKSYTLGIRM